MSDQIPSPSPPERGHTTIATRFHEAGPDGRIGLVPLANYLQQAAGEHADALGLGAQRLMEDGLYWVLTRQYVEIHRWPKGGSRITVETWPSDRPRQLFRRDFLVRDDVGAELARATSAWALIDGETRRAVKAPPWTAAAIAYDTSRATQFPDRKAAPSGLPDHERHIVTRWSDLDQNGHVNNASLAGFVLEALPIGYLEQHKLAALDLVFRAECDADNRVQSRAVASGPGRFTHSVVRPDGKEAVQAVSSWSVRDGS